MTSLNTAREVVTVAKFLAEESGIECDQAAVDDKLFLLGVATEVVKASEWREGLEDF